MTQLEGLKNFSLNIQGTMFRIKDATRKSKSAKLGYYEQDSILQFYLEVVDYLSKETK